MPRRLAVVAALVLALAPHAFSSAAQRFPTPTDDTARTPPIRSSGGLLFAAERFITAQNERLLTANVVVPSALAQNAILTERAAVNDARRVALATHGLRYTSAATTFSNGFVDVDGPEAHVALTEGTTLALAYTNGDRTPLPSYQYQRTYDFTFRYDDGEWRVTAQVPREDFPLAEATGEPVDAAAFHVEADDERMESPFAPRVEALATGTKTLNRSAIVGYAWAFVGSYLHTTRTEGYNSQYRVYTNNDCTNFVSQAVKYGGWTEVLGFYTWNSAWWYTPNPLPLTPGASYTWAGAQNWSNFVSTSGRGYLTDSVKNLQPGDVLQADWNNDGVADHTMIVTKRDTLGNIFLTYHSVNERDRSFWDIDAQQKKVHPNLTYRRWRLRDQFN